MRKRRTDVYDLKQPHPRPPGGLDHRQLRLLHELDVRGLLPPEVAEVRDHCARLAEHEPQPNLAGGAEEWQRKVRAAIDAGKTPPPAPAEVRSDVAQLEAHREIRRRYHREWAALAKTVLPLVAGNTESIWRWSQDTYLAAWQDVDPYAGLAYSDALNETTVEYHNAYHGLRAMHTARQIWFGTVTATRAKVDASAKSLRAYHYAEPARKILNPKPRLLKALANAYADAELRPPMSLDELAEAVAAERRSYRSPAQLRDDYLKRAGLTVVAR